MPRVSGNISSAQTLEGVCVINGRTFEDNVLVKAKAQILFKDGQKLLF